jgi:hypothetical protein
MIWKPAARAEVILNVDTPGLMVLGIKTRWSLVILTWTVCPVVPEWASAVPVVAPETSPAVTRPSEVIPAARRRFDDM